MKKQWMLSLSCATLFLLAGCDAFLNFQLFSSDLKEIASGKVQKMDVQATIAMESSEDSYEEMKSFLSKYFRGATNFRTEKKDYSDNIKADYKLPVVAGSVFDPASPDLVTVLLKAGEGGSYEMGLAFNNELFKTLNEEASSTFFASVNMDEISIKLEFNNDLPDTLTTVWRAVYVNGQPAPVEKKHTLAKRERLEIEVSEIFKKALQMNNEVVFFGKVES